MTETDKRGKDKKLDAMAGMGEEETTSAWPRRSGWRGAVRVDVEGRRKPGRGGQEETNAQNKII